MADSCSTEITSSSLSSHFRPQPKYDVFLSFSGVDTRKSFTDHLLAALERRGIDTFRDDTKLSRGEDIKTQLPKAIEESRISIVVFSKNYAASEWCLDELVKIMDCKKSFQQIVLPIFYDVDPSEVRGLKRSFAEAFSEHQTCKKAEEWRSTLIEVANLSGRVLQNEASGHEAKFIERIVEDVEKKLNFVPLCVADYPVGMKFRLQRVTKRLRMESNDAHIVAIWGIGGIGKTTIAKAVYNHFHGQFDGCSFIADIRETSKNGPVLLQNNLLSDILGKEYANIRNFHEGIEFIKRRVFCRKLLLVLDDVDHVDQLKALAIDQKFLCPGSRIIITTRDISSLNSLKVIDGEYMPEELNKSESLQLFSGHAFKGDNPMVDYTELLNEVVHYSRGLPLVLCVLGSSLSNKSISEWRSAIAELKKIPHDDVQEKLKISFDSLSAERKQLFLDIACFFVGMDRDFTIKTLKGCGFYPENGIKELHDRCLMNFTNNRIVMHDVVRDMGREIVRQESVNPGKRSRLWDPEDSLQVLRDRTGTIKIEGLFLNLADEDFFQNLQEAKDVEAHAKAFKKMKRLRLLSLNFVHLTVGLEHISKRLAWLSWKGFPLTCVPSNLSMENLVTLDLSYSKLKRVWEKSKVLKNLKFLYLSHCYYLTTTPDFSGLNNLEKLLLNDCIKLEKVHESVTCLNKLLVLNMENCRRLRKLPGGILMLKSLECLNLSSCRELENFTGFNGSLASAQGLSCMKRLQLQNCNLSHIPREIGNLISLTNLDLSYNNFGELPNGIGNLTCLKILSMYESNVSHLPDGISSLISLRELCFGGKEMDTFPGVICDLPRLESLHIIGHNFSGLPNKIEHLSSLNCLVISGGNLCTLPDSIGKLDCLSRLVLEGNVSHLPESIRNLPQLENLVLNNSKMLRSLPALPESIELVQVFDCTSLESISLETDWLNEPEMIFRGCSKLAETFAAKKFRERLLEYSGLSSLWNPITIRFESEVIPTWIEYRSTGACLCLRVPPLVNQKLLGLILWTSFTFRETDWDSNAATYRISNTSKGCEKVYQPYWGPCDMEPHDETWFSYLPLCYLEMQIGDQDEVEILVVIEDEASVVKNWGVSPVYEVDKNNAEANDGALIKCTSS